MFPTFSFFVRSILSSSALAASVPSAKSFFRFSSSSASRCWRFSRCSRIMRLLSMFGWKLSSSSESSIRSHLLSADARAKSQRGVCAGPSRTGAGREQDKLTSGSQFVKDMARPAERVVGEAAGSRANDASDASRRRPRTQGWKRRNLGAVAGRAKARRSTCLLLRAMQRRRVESLVLGALSSSPVHRALVLVSGTNIAVLLCCSKSSRQCSLYYLLTY